MRSGEYADLIHTAAVASLSGVDPMRMLALGGADYAVAQAVVEKADAIALERKKAELEALAKAVRI